MLLSISDVANQFHISKKELQTLCESGQIDCAKNIKGVWYITIDTKTNCLLQNLHNHTETISLKEVCNILSISYTTAKNWIRLGKLNTLEDGKTFHKNYIQKLLKEMQNGNDNRLKSRRNKKNIKGKILYKNYIQNKNNIAVVEKIIALCKNITENELKIIIAYFAIQLYNQSNGLPAKSTSLFDKNLKYTINDVFYSLILDFIGDIDILHTNLCHINSVFDYELQFITNEDTLGFIYISLCDLNQRKQTGVYYTPQKTVELLIQNLLHCTDIKNKLICDPCCGTGNFLIGLLNNGIEAKNIYGQDIDNTSILIARITLFLLHKDFTKEQLYSQIVCGNTLENTFHKKFSIVLGNPPWGYHFSAAETKYLLNNYYTAKNKSIESYDIFIEKGISLLEKNGYMAYVVPEALLNVQSHMQAREYIIQNCSFQFVCYLENAFSGVQCPAILLGIQYNGKCKTKNCKVLYHNTEFTIKQNRNIDTSTFSFHMNDEEYICFHAICSIQNAVYLANHAIFALGIVTGNNKKYIKNTQQKDFEVILKGNDIFKYSIKKPHQYIQFTPQYFQQSAHTEIYRANEKLLYRFISRVPVFAYDNQQMLSLNSCNILIPQIEGMHIKYILAILNSSVAAYFMIKKFHSIKLLRSHIESLPIPFASEKKQQQIINKVDQIMNTNQNAIELYEQLDIEIMELYHLQPQHIKTIKNALPKNHLFIASDELSK